MSQHGDQLLHVANCEVFEVTGQQQPRVAEVAPLTVTAAADSVVIQVGSLTLPLAREVLVLKSAKGAYTFAVSGAENGTFYLVRLPDSTPAADESLLEEVLDASTSYQAGLGGVTQDSIAADVAEVADALMSQPQPGAGPGAGPGAASAAPAEAKSYAERIHDGSEQVQAAAAAAAVYACQRIAALSDSMAARLTPVDRPVTVHPILKGVLERVARHSKRVATGVLHVAHAWPTKVADALVARLGGRATLVQDELAPGQPLATRRGAAKEIACASVLAVVDVYAAMAEAAETVVHTSGAAATRLVEHKYGEDAGQAAGSVASVAKSMTKVMRARRTGMTAVATRVARHTAVGLASQGRAPAAPAVAGARSS